MSVELPFNFICFSGSPFLCLLVEVLGGSEPLTPIMPSSVSWCQSKYLDALIFLTGPLLPCSPRIKKDIYQKSISFQSLMREICQL